MTDINRSYGGKMKKLLGYFFIFSPVIALLVYCLKSDQIGMFLMTTGITGLIVGVIGLGVVLIDD
jgi:hypothetical protein